jgi:hypothetical protein
VQRHRDEALAGTTEVAATYQGAARQDNAAVSASFPETITSGAGQVQFTTTVDNPSPDDIEGSRLTFLMAADNTATLGATADQVHLQYADATTDGQFVNVALEGTTVDDGVIFGYLGPEVGADFPGDSSRTTKLRISFDADVPASDVTGFDLVIEMQLDRFNAASGPVTNPGYIGTNDSTVLASQAPAGPAACRDASAPAGRHASPPPTVTITMPGPPKGCTVPKLVGQTYANARKRLKVVSCPRVTITRPSAARPRAGSSSSSASVRRRAR